MAAPVRNRLNGPGLLRCRPNVLLPRGTLVGELAQLPAHLRQSVVSVFLQVGHGGDQIRFGRLGFGAGNDGQADHHDRSQTHDQGKAQTRVAGPDDQNRHRQWRQADAAP